MTDASLYDPGDASLNDPGDTSLNDPGDASPHDAAKQRGRGSAFFAFPLATAALSSIILVVANVLQILSDARKSDFDNELIVSLVGLGLCLGTFSLSSFLLAWSLAASLASNGIAATNRLWIKAFRIVVRVQSMVPLVDTTLNLISAYGGSLMYTSYIATFFNSLFFIAVTMPWLSCKLRGLSAAKSRAFRLEADVAVTEQAVNIAEQLTGFDFDRDGDVGERGRAQATEPKSQVIARLDDLRRAARNSAALSIFVTMVCLIYIISLRGFMIVFSEPFIVPLVGTIIMTALVLPLHNVSVGLQRLLAKYSDDPKVHPIDISEAPASGDGDGLPITVLGDDGAPCTVGMAPHVPLPSFLDVPTEACKWRQADVDPTCWSLSIAQWLQCVRFVRDTPTWRSLAKAKGGEGCISMYDVNTHFIIPWTRGSGCSVALLFHNNSAAVTNQGGRGSGAGPLPVELMLSHAWAGSVVEVYAAIQSLLGLHALPESTRLFYCAFCMYQPDDGAPGGLSISEQLNKGPFAKIIDNRVKHGMYIVHTTTTEVYTRLWCVHEVDEADAAKVDMRGLFDTKSWTVGAFRKASRQETATSTCSNPEDSAKLTQTITGRGGFDRLDDVIADFRGKMLRDLRVALQFELLFGLDVSSLRNDSKRRRRGLVRSQGVKTRVKG